MDTPDEFERQVHATLAHLYDPNYQPSPLLYQAISSDPLAGAKPVQSAIVQAIRDLRPDPNTPPYARSRRLYEILSCRYVDQLTQEETALRLGISSRYLRREQGQAIQMLARHLWERSHESAAPAESRAERQDGDSVAWRAQLRQELAYLQKSGVSPVADLGEILQNAAELGQTLAARHGVKVSVGYVQPNLAATVHPSVLRQVVVAAVAELVRHMSSGEVALGAESQDGRVIITVKGKPIITDKAPRGDLIGEILATQDGAVTVQMAENQVVFSVRLPAATTVTVLVIDDNTDLVHFYRRYATGTRYQIVHALEGQSAFAAIEASTPDIIVLDVMLPDMDGWALLSRLHEHPASRMIPVIVCSVIREEELALALGAVAYIPKPVRHQEFIQVLDKAASFRLQQKG
jgi:CheY-like chemotaxis protein